jgi:hypothetical protein
MMMRSRLPALTLVLVALGCNQAPKGPDLAPVVGTVRWQGQPLGGALVRFIPVGATQGGGGTAITEENGTYVLMDTRGGKGVVTGEYKVVISRRVDPPGSPPSTGKGEHDSRAKETLPENYSDARQTELTAQVGDGARPIDFELK